MHRSIKRFLAPLALALGLMGGTASAGCDGDATVGGDSYVLVLSSIVTWKADPSYAVVTVRNPGSGTYNVGWREAQQRLDDFSGCGETYGGNLEECGDSPYLWTLGPFQTLSHVFTVATSVDVGVIDVFPTTGGLPVTTVSADLYASDKTTGTPISVVYDHVVLERLSCW